ncbi:hypothetical protein E2C01_019689 [Portunus trituberculatus]|uniref:Uncharacterized protein n=1 Tax=Portunus trituberculatus TaxID=210409 RepID=A0A5B7E021_PORTR|nr:hypothetical protein [Portunus trituberculatus]
MAVTACLLRTTLLLHIKLHACTTHTHPSIKIKNINVPRSDYSLGDDSKSLDTSLNFFFINFCNIRDLRSNFQSMKHYLSSAKTHLFVTETRLSEATDSSPLSLSSYFLYPHFRSISGCCVYVRNDLTCPRAHAVQSSKFSTMGFRLKSHPLIKSICAIYFSRNSSDYKKNSLII